MFGCFVSELVRNCFDDCGSTHRRKTTLLLHVIMIQVFYLICNLQSVLPVKYTSLLGKMKVFNLHFEALGSYAQLNNSFDYEDLSFISETGHDRNPLRLLRNVTNLYPYMTVKQ